MPKSFRFCSSLASLKFYIFAFGGGGKKFLILRKMIVSYKLQKYEAVFVWKFKYVSSGYSWAESLLGCQLLSLVLSSKTYLIYSSLWCWSWTLQLQYISPLPPDSFLGSEIETGRQRERKTCSFLIACIPYSHASFSDLSYLVVSQSEDSVL